MVVRGQQRHGHGHATGEWIIVDAGGPATVHAVQINFADQDAAIVGRRATPQLQVLHRIRFSRRAEWMAMATRRSQSPSWTYAPTRTTGRITTSSSPSRCLVHAWYMLGACLVLSWQGCGSRTCTCLAGRSSRYRGSGYLGSATVRTQATWEWLRRGIDPTGGT